MRGGMVASGLVLGMLTGLLTGTPWAASQESPAPAAAPADVEGIELFVIESRLLTEFRGRPMAIQAGVVLPPGHDASRRDTPVCCSIHGFGGSHREAWDAGARLRTAMREHEYPELLYVYLNSQFPLGHHELWPQGMLPHIHNAMPASRDRHLPPAKPVP